MTRLRVRALGYGAILVGLLVGCPKPAERPTSYGQELEACETKAAAATDGGTPGGWTVYTPCCVDVATKYDRDPAFCFQDAP